MIEPIQVILILFVLFALSRAWLQFQEGRIKKIELMGWIILWLIAIVVIALPNTAGYLSNELGIGRPVDLIVYVAIVLLFYLNFRIYIALDGVEQKITKVVREVATKNEKKK